MQVHFVRLVRNRAEHLALRLRRIGQKPQRLIAVDRQHHVVEAHRLGAARLHLDVVAATHNRLDRRDEARSWI